jgi:hypothetical protein
MLAGVYTSVDVAQLQLAKHNRSMHPTTRQSSRRSHSLTSVHLLTCHTASTGSGYMNGG